MKTTTFKAITILVGLMLVNAHNMSAGAVTKFQKFAGDQMSNFNTNGLLLIGGIIGASLIIYIISNHLVKDKEEGVVGQKSQGSKQNYHRHHHARQVVKKTS